MCVWHHKTSAIIMIGTDYQLSTPLASVKIYPVSKNSGNWQYQSISYQETDNTCKLYNLRKISKEIFIKVWYWEATRDNVVCHGYYQLGEVTIAMLKEASRENSNLKLEDMKRSPDNNCVKLNIGLRKSTMPQYFFRKSAGE